MRTATLTGRRSCARRMAHPPANQGPPSFFPCPPLPLRIGAHCARGMRARRGPRRGASERETRARAPVWRSPRWTRGARVGVDVSVRGAASLLAAQVPRTPHMRVPPGPLWPRLHAHRCSPLGCTRDGRAYAAARGRPSPPIAALRSASASKARGSNQARSCGYAHHCQSLPLAVNHCQSLQLNANHCQSLLITANHANYCQPLPTSANLRPTTANHRQSLLITANHY